MRAKKSGETGLGEERGWESEWREREGERERERGRWGERG